MSIIKFNLTSASIMLEEETRVTFEERTDGWYYFLEEHQVFHKLKYHPFIQKKEDFQQLTNESMAYVYVQKDMVESYKQFLMDFHKETIENTNKYIKALLSSMENNTYSALLQTLFKMATSNRLLKASNVVSINLNEYIDLDPEEGISFPMDYDWHRSTFDHLAEKDIHISFGYHNDTFSCYISITSLCTEDLFVDTVQKAFRHRLKQDQAFILAHI